MITGRTKTDDRHSVERRLAGFLRDPRYEVIPLAGAEEAVERSVPKGMKLTVTSSAALEVERTLEAAENLIRAGYRVVPHLAARLIRDRSQLAEILARLGGIGVSEVFVIAGDALEPAGEFEESAALLRAMSEMEYGNLEVGISGYPESHPLISDEATIRAMFEKEPYSTRIVSQICFDPKVTNGWIKAIRARGVKLPIQLGIPGVVSRQKLMRISTKIGLGESARFLRKNRGWLLKLFASGGYAPDRLIRGLVPAIMDEDSRVSGFHVFTFNELEKTEKWRRETLKRLESSRETHQKESST